MNKINIKELQGNAVSMFDDKWCLITAGTKESYNTMTASWGAMGELWNKDVCFIFIRPQRYTLEFTEREEYFTLSFFSEDYKKALAFCGRNSGRDCDKAKETGLTYGPSKIVKAPIIMESPLSIECKVKQVIPLGSHDMFLAEVVNVQADDRYLNQETGEWNLAEADPLVYTHGKYFHLGDMIGKFGWSVKKK